MLTAPFIQMDLLVSRVAGPGYRVNPTAVSTTPVNPGHPVSSFRWC